MRLQATGQTAAWLQFSGKRVRTAGRWQGFAPGRDRAAWPEPPELNTGFPRAVPNDALSFRKTSGEISRRAARRRASWKLCNVSRNVATSLPAEARFSHTVRDRSSARLCSKSGEAMIAMRSRAAMAPRSSWRERNHEGAGTELTGGCGKAKAQSRRCASSPAIRSSNTVGVPNIIYGVLYDSPAQTRFLDLRGTKLAAT